MSDNLNASELLGLIDSVFCPAADERLLMIMVDLPDSVVVDDRAWAERRETACEWARTIAADSRYEVIFAAYRNPRMNNADLPAGAWLLSPDALPPTADELPECTQVAFEEIFARRPMILAPTEFSATAPLKMAARRHGFRGATMPGFCRQMVDALRLDYAEVNRRVEMMASLLDVATGATFHFRVDGAAGAQPLEMKLFLDLRHRAAHRSGGRFPSPGQVGNLPSGEAYIVPYEGELPGDPSASAGMLPVQFGSEVVIFRIENNVAVEASGEGPAAVAERARLAAEPAYGNMAELGVGVLGDFGIKPLGEILIDEKLGLHIAFGRSDHFGGQVGPARFSSPAAVVHIDRVYIPEMQPMVHVVRAALQFEGRPDVDLVRDDVPVFAF
ncbi:MAG TPA: hypothetical protein PKH54_07780 [Myxococcota bacterium]|nr:hypothetical protein [Myxococcota bacterium]